MQGKRKRESAGKCMRFKLCIQLMLLSCQSTRPAPPPESLRVNLKWTEYILLFRLVPGKVAAKNSSYIIVSNSLLGHTYVFSRGLRQCLSRLKGGGSSCTRGSIHTTLKIITLCMELWRFYWIGTMLCQEKETAEEPKSTHRKFQTSLRMKGL